MDRGAITYSAAYLAGISAALFLKFPLPATLVLIPLFLAISYTTRKKAAVFLIATHSALFIAGAGAAGMAAEAGELPQGRIASAISCKCSELRESATRHLAAIVPGEEEHATLCALAIGEKRLMDRKLKEDYSRAGAMHVLALSGLHIGIVFAIIYKLLSFLCLIPWGNAIRNILAMLFIFSYALFTGGSPSVVRAAFMILIYKIAGMSFRQVGKWDSIALSAMIIGIISPLQIKSIGFQLSYAAVIGIAVLYPTCRAAYRQFATCCPGIGKMALWAGGKIWDSISISVCCQITTLPFVMYYFGSSPDWFLLANIVAVPAASIILYLAVVAVATQWIPFAGELSAEALAFTIRLLNTSISYISN